jgi:hypothetical protein
VGAGKVSVKTILDVPNQQLSSNAPDDISAWGWQGVLISIKGFLSYFQAVSLGFHSSLHKLGPFEATRSNVGRLEDSLFGKKRIKDRPRNLFQIFKLAKEPHKATNCPSRNKGSAS